MSESVHTNTSIWSKGMMSVIAAQFLSAFGDNALLFATLALLKEQFYPDWSQPILQMVFVGAYILFAPFVGQVADSFAKGRVMMFANTLKLLGAASICFGINPFLGYTLVGIGAAAYSPACKWSSRRLASAPGASAAKPAGENSAPSTSAAASGKAATGRRSACMWDLPANDGGRTIGRHRARPRQRRPSRRLGWGVGRQPAN